MNTVKDYREISDVHAAHVLLYKNHGRYHAINISDNCWMLMLIIMYRFCRHPYQPTTASDALYFDTLSSQSMTPVGRGP